MKRVCKGSPPQSLGVFVAANPEATWEDMSYDNTQGGARAAHDCRDKTIDDQNGLCAYCEQTVSSLAPMRRRLEHFHPKSDKSGAVNWGLDWGNMLAACDGGSWRVTDEEKSYPLPGNLSCDEHKNHMVITGKLSIECEGRLLNPLDAPAFPNVFLFEKGTWHLKPNEAACACVEIPGNVFQTTAELVSQTISILNLNCDRLADRRKLLVWNIERNKKTLRDKNIPHTEMQEKLVQRYFTKKWPEFFTTLRCLLGDAAEDYLALIEYRG